MGFPHKRIMTIQFISINWIFGYFTYILELGILKCSCNYGLLDRYSLEALLQGTLSCLFLNPH